MRRHSKKLLVALAICLLAPLGLTAAFAQGRSECESACQEELEECSDLCHEHARQIAAECVNFCRQMHEECLDEC